MIEGLKRIFVPAISVWFSVCMLLTQHVIKLLCWPSAASLAHFCLQNRAFAGCSAGYPFEISTITHRKELGFFCMCSVSSSYWPTKEFQCATPSLNMIFAHFLNLKMRWIVFFSIQYAIAYKYVPIKRSSTRSTWQFNNM